MVPLTKETAFVGLRVVRSTGNGVAGVIANIAGSISVLWDDFREVTSGYSAELLASYMDEIVPMTEDEIPRQGARYMCIDDKIVPIPGIRKGVSYQFAEGDTRNRRTLFVAGFGAQPFYKHRFGLDKYALENQKNITLPLKTSKDERPEHTTDFNRPVPVQVLDDETKIVGGQQSRGSAIRS